MVYEHASDGSLGQVFDNPPVEVTEYGFLPEGMVWHVCLGMLRALAWLHEGMRERVFWGAEEVLRRGWWRVDGDWMPVLHRGVKEENIWFMPARGRETYGMVKLGGFERAVVCSGSGEGMVYAFENEEVVSLETEKEVWREICREDWREMDAVSFACKVKSRGSLREEIYVDVETQDRRPYTIGGEVQALGRILYRMMKGEQYPADEQCACTCYHVEPETPCPHDCIVSDFYLEDKFLEGTHKYSAELVEVIHHLLSATMEAYLPTSERYRQAFMSYETWRQGTNEGKKHVDHYDDLLERKRFARNKEEERLVQGMRAVQAERKMSGKWTEEELEQLAREDQRVVRKTMTKWLVDNGRLLEWEM